MKHSVVIQICSNKRTCGDCEYLIHGVHVVSCCLFRDKEYNAPLFLEKDKKSHIYRCADCLEAEQKVTH